MVTDLELAETVDPSGTPMYHCLFNPKNEFALRTAKKWGASFTSDVAFLKESVQFMKSVDATEHDPAEFIKVWKRINESTDFNAVYHYVEYSNLQALNASSTFLTIMSVYCMTSPLMFFLSPLLVILMPFALLKAKNEAITFAEYKNVLYSVLEKHSLGAIFTGGFAAADASKKLYMLLTAVFFGVQIYTNVQSCYTFFKNLTVTHETLGETRGFLKHVLAGMKAVGEVSPPTYAAFLSDMGAQEAVLRKYYDALCDVKPLSWWELNQIGVVRRLFHQLHGDASLKAALAYGMDFHGYLDNVRNVKMLMAAKVVNACKFSSGGTSFKKARYPPLKETVPNSYEVKNYAITGPNASGKTTFIKTTMVNVLLSQQLGVGFYRRATIHPYEQLWCYLNIPDTSGRDSLFQAEARRCKEIIDGLCEKRALCIFDELYSGTNPEEASASAYAFLRYLSERKTCTFLLTTHFVDVCEKIQSHCVTNVHMKTENVEERLQYFYELKSGISRVKGALKVLQDLNYPSSIVDFARVA
jgi:hypothetical protein